LEKILTTEERIKRAEEIYEKRKNKQMNMNTATVNVSEKRNFKLFKKVILQVLACSMIYYLFSWAQSTPYFASKDNVENIKKIFSQDFDFQKMYNGFQENFMNLQYKEEKNDESNAEKESVLEETNQTLEEATLSVTEDVSSQQQIESEVVEQQLTQMEKDAKSIKEKYSLIKPIEGPVSSGFGQRESNNSIVSTNHLGIDIAADEGSKIKAAMEGIVAIAKYSDSYRKLY